MKAVKTSMLGFLSILFFFSHSRTIFSQDNIASSFNYKSSGPNAICRHDTLAFTFNSNGKIVIHTNQIDAGSYDDQTPYEKLKFYFNKQSKSDSIEFWCDDFLFLLGDCDKRDLLNYILYVEDEDQNIDSCNFTINVNDQNSLCPFGGKFIRVELRTLKREFVNSRIRLIKDSMILDEINAPHGQTQVEEDFCRGEFDIIPYRNDDHLNGVTTADIIRVKNHILGTNRRINPYILLAADVNQSHSITGSDIAEMRKLILGIQSKFSRSPSWRFVPESYIFQDPSYPYLCPDKYHHIYNGTNNATNLNFIGYKIGDVNSTATSDVVNQDSKTRAISTLLNGKIIETSDRIFYQITCNEKIDFAGIQFCLQFDTDALKFVDYNSNLVGLNSDNFGFQKLDDGKILLSYDHIQGIEIESNHPIICFSFKKKKQLPLFHFSFDEDLIPSELIHFNGDINGLKLNEFQDHDIDFISIQPNPTKDIPVFRINSMGEQKVSIIVTNEYGLQVYDRLHYLSTGKNEVQPHCSQISNGIYFYRIQSSEGVYSGKFIVQK